MKRIYFGGRFYFDYKESNYQNNVKNDYRVSILGNQELLLKKQKYVKISDNIQYIGPFYFESAGMDDKEIVSEEIKMIKKSTDLVFLLDDALCPGTIGELMLANNLGKKVYIFYVKKDISEETESILHTPCWFPIIMSIMLNKNCKLIPCKNIRDAKEKINNTINVLDKNETIV